MADVDEIIDYIKSLKRGFDKDLFQIKVDQLAYAVDTTGLVYNDFHTLFKVWLNLAIPAKKWVDLGSCLVPPDTVERRTVEYALRWILANIQNHEYFSRVAFLLDWLTAAMECESIDMMALDEGYEVFCMILAYDVLTVHTMKLVYTLTKPLDVTRRRVLELIHFAEQRLAKKSLYRQLQVLLGLFKSYKPEYVPEAVPAISIHTAFKKLNVDLLARFRSSQQRRSNLSRERQHLKWINPLNYNKKAEPLVPNIEFIKMGSDKHDKEPPKNFLDFSDPVSLVQYSLHYEMSRPARLRALLCNATGQMMLVVTYHVHHAFLTHDFHHLFNTCFLEVSPYSYMEKQDLLQRLAQFQRTLVQGVPIITRFLAQYLPLWNEKDYFPEILELVEWVSVEFPAHALCVVDALGGVYLRAQPLEQCAILRSLTNMYDNLVYASKKPQQESLNSPPPAVYSLVLPDIAGRITDLCNKGLQVAPDDMRVLYTAVRCSQRRAMAELSQGVGIGALPPPIMLALPLLGVSAVLVEYMADLMILYKTILTQTQTKNEGQIETLNKYMTDFLNCLYSEEALSGRQNGLIFEKMQPQLAAKLASLMPDVDAKLSIRNHPAFVPYTYTYTFSKQGDADNNMLYSVIKHEFTNLGRFLKKSLSALR